MCQEETGLRCSDKSTPAKHRSSYKKRPEFIQTGYTQIRDGMISIRFYCELFLTLNTFLRHIAKLRMVLILKYKTIS
jgi:hypothetical protein